MSDHRDIALALVADAGDASDSYAHDHLIRSAHVHALLDIADAIRTTRTPIEGA